MAIAALESARADTDEGLYDKVLSDVMLLLLVVLASILVFSEKSRQVVAVCHHHYENDYQTQYSVFY